jgi:hypothetical protein
MSRGFVGVDYLAFRSAAVAGFGDFGGAEKREVMADEKVVMIEVVCSLNASDSDHLEFGSDSDFARVKD